MGIFDIFKKKKVEVVVKPMEEKLQECGAKTTPFMTNEKWVDEHGKIHYIDYAHIDWEKAQRGK